MEKKPDTQQPPLTPADPGSPDDHKKSGNKPKMWGPIAGLGLGFLVYILAQIFVGVVFGAMASSKGLSDIGEYYDNFTVEASFIASIVIGLTIVTFIFLATRRYGGWKALKLDKFKLGDIGWALPGFIAYFVMVAILFALTAVFAPQVDLEQEQVLGFEQAASNLQLVAVFIALVVIAPISEEILFRGYTYQGLRSKIHWIPAAIISSGLFALAHMQLNVGIDTFALGLVACLLLEKTNSLYPAILLHGIKNFIAFYVVYIVGTGV